LAVIAFILLTVTAANLQELGWLMMLMPLGIILGMGGLVLYCAWRRRRLPRFFTKSNGGPADAARFPGCGRRRAGASLFERPACWLAVKCDNAAVVQAALNLRHAVPCSWEAGLVETSAGKLFVSRPISGWVLVVGPGLPEPADDVDGCYRFLRALSRKLGNVQFYSANRVLNHHAWALLEDGVVYRAYAWAGRTLWNEGFVTAAERELDMVCLDYGCEANTPACRESLAADTEKLNQLAGRWSLDPAAIAPSRWRSQGIVGEVSHARPY
jgi:hypothetical protein